MMPVRKPEYFDYTDFALMFTLAAAGDILIDMKVIDMKVIDLQFIGVQLIGAKVETFPQKAMWPGILHYLEKMDAD